MKQKLSFALAFIIPSGVALHAEESLQLPPDVAKLVADTHAESLKLREDALRKTIAKDTCWPTGVWGDNLWCLAALSLNEKVDAANARLLKRAKECIASKPASAPRTSPENPGNLPWTFFSVTDYVRTLYLFHSKSPHFPGRLKPETEAAMKETLWLWASTEGTQPPRINGATVTLNPPKTFDSPFLSMVHGSSKAVIRYPGHEDLELDLQSESKAGQK